MLTTYGVAPVILDMLKERGISCIPNIKLLVVLCCLFLNKIYQQFCYYGRCIIYIT